MAFPAPAALVTTWHGGALLERCLASLRAQRLSPSRLLVVLARPRPELLPSGIDALVLPDETHFAAAANRGLRALRGAGGFPDILLLNDDTEADPGLVAALHAARVRGGAAIYQPRILLDEAPGQLDNLGHRLFLDGFNLAHGRGQADPPRLEATSCGAFSGAGALLCGEVLDRVGLFDEELEAFGEDLDLSLRAVRQGFDIRLVPDARLRHALGRSYGRQGADKLRRVQRNHLRAAARSLPASALLLSPLSGPSRLLRVWWRAQRGEGPAVGLGVQALGPVLHGTVEGLSALPRALRRRAEDRARWQRGEAEMLRWLWRHRVR